MIKINKENIKRLINDIKDIVTNPLAENGIFYLHDNENMLKGYCMIVGPEETPYFGGFYFFEFNFPENYPYSPPVLKYKTNTPGVRFNPNLYNNEKVCVSILNTWSGEQWSSCQTIRSILLSLLTLLMTKTPLLNEPGYNTTNYENKKNKYEYENYTKAIEFCNINYAYCDIFLKRPNIYSSFFSLFEEYYFDIFGKNFDFLFNFVNEKIKTQSRKEYIYISCYNMKVNIDYEELFKKMQKCKNDYESLKSLK